MRRWLISLVGLVVAAGCGDLQIDDGTLGCSSDNRCPEGFVCAADHRCYSEGKVPTIDLRATADAGMDWMVLEVPSDLALDRGVPDEADATMHPDLAHPDLEMADLRPVVASTPPTSLWMSSGGGSAESQGEHLNFTVGGSLVAGTVTAGASAACSYGAFASGTY